MKKIILGLVLLVLTGCFIDDEQAKLEVKNIDEKYLKTLKEDKILDPLRKNYWIGDVNEAPFSYFVNKNFIQPNEKPLLERLQSVRAIRQSELRSWYSKYHPHLFQLYDSLNIGLFTNFTDLYNGKITHGEYLVKKKEIYSQYKKAVDNRLLEIELHNSQIRSQALNTFLTQLNNQQLINSINNAPTRIAPFTCQNYGRTINCW
jgi:hypothetical protein